MELCQELSHSITQHLLDVIDLLMLDILYKNDDLNGYTVIVIK